MAFTRRLEQDLINKLKKEKLYQYLLDDIKKCEIFPAIRNNEIHFYYKGGRLFKYTKDGFSSHIKYAFVCNDEEPDGDIKESDLTTIQHITNFTEGYERIKEYCAKYNKDSESEYVSRLFKNYSYINTQSKDDIVLLDIEAAFSQEKSKNQDRFDIVLYNKNTHEIKIVEAKLYSNSELHPTKNSQPQVVGQIQRYEDKIEECKSEIITAYKNYLNLINNIFHTNLPTKCEIEDKVGLLYFSFSDNDKKSEKFKTLKNTLTKALPNHKIYVVGNTKDASLKLLF